MTFPKCSAPICRCIHYTFVTFVHNYNYNFRYSLASTYGNTAFVYTVSINIYCTIVNERKKKWDIGMRGGACICLTYIIFLYLQYSTFLLSNVKHIYQNIKRWCIFLFYCLLWVESYPLSQVATHNSEILLDLIRTVMDMNNNHSIMGHMVRCSIIFISCC